MECYKVFVTTYTMSNVGRVKRTKCDGWSDSFDSFDSLEEAREFATECAKSEIVEVRTHTRNGNGSVTYDVYDFEYREYDEEGEIISSFSYDDCASQLDFHPAIELAFETATRRWVEFADCLESQLGYGWREAVERNADLGKSKANFVVNDYGTPIDFPNACAVMDDEIRRQVRDSFGDRYFTDQEFFEEYLDWDKNCPVRELH